MVPKSFGRFEILGEMGRGAMGIVYKGKDPKLDRIVAIKSVNFTAMPNSPENRQLKARFMQEARAIGQLQHPNILTIYDVGEEGDDTYLAMEYVDSGNLEEAIREKKFTDLPTILELVAQIAEGLGHAHSKGIIHRDVKPANIMLSHGKIPKISDFGLAKIKDSTLSIAGSVVGTPSYMAPEQIEGKKIDGRADLFSLGAILYEMITGEKAFQGDNITTIIHRVMSTDPTIDGLAKNQIPSNVAAIIRKAISKHADDRHKTGEEFAQELRRIKDGGGVPKIEPGSDLSTLLEAKRRIEKALDEEFNKVLTVMFTDLVGSTAITESAGDIASRELLEYHNGIVFPAIKENNGVLVKTIGDGTLSYFNTAQDGVRAAAKIQRAIEEFNATKTVSIPIRLRIGLNTGKCGIEKNDIFGDVVNTASRIESAANPGEVFVSAETVEALSDQSEIPCKFHRKVALKGKKELMAIYKVVWKTSEVSDVSNVSAAEVKSKTPLIAGIVASVVLVVGVGIFFASRGKAPSEVGTATPVTTPATPTPPDAGKPESAKTAATAGKAPAKADAGKAKADAAKKPAVADAGKPKAAPDKKSAKADAEKSKSKEASDKKPVSAETSAGEKGKAAEGQKHAEEGKKEEAKESEKGGISGVLSTLGSTGTLKINAMEGDQISLDARNFKGGKLTINDVSAGNHSLFIVRKGKKPLLMTITVKPGETLEITPEFK